MKFRKIIAIDLGDVWTQQRRSKCGFGNSQMMRHDAALLESGIIYERMKEKRGVDRSRRLIPLRRDFLAAVNGPSALPEAPILAISCVGIVSSTHSKFKI
jgi:hypothetical protein